MSERRSRTAASRLKGPGNASIEDAAESPRTPERAAEDAIPVTRHTLSRLSSPASIARAPAARSAPWPVPGEAGLGLPNEGDHRLSLVLAALFVLTIVAVWLAAI